MRRALVLVLLALLAACGEDPRDEAAVTSTSAPRAASAPDGMTVTVSLAPLRANGACGVPRQRRHDPSLDAVTGALGIFRRPQHESDALAEAEVEGLPADDIDFGSTRSPSGLGTRLILVPTQTVKTTCDADPAGEDGSGVCLIRAGTPEIASRCFEMDAIREGRAAALADVEEVIGLVPDGVERVIVEIAAERTEASVVENTYLARVPRSDRSTEARITFVHKWLDGCEPSAAMRAAAPTLNRPADPGGVPEIVRRSVRPDIDSGIAAKYARIWGGGDEITYWIVPHLRCEVASLEADMVCVTPVKESYAKAAGACVEPGKTGWIHFPDGGVSAIAGFAPAYAREAVVRVEGGTAVLPVKDRVFAGRLEDIPLKGEVGAAHIEYR